MGPRNGLPAVEDSFAASRATAVVSATGGVIGAIVTVAGIVTAFLPSDDVRSVVMLELKMVAGVGGIVAIGLWLYWRSRARVAT